MTDRTGAVGRVPCRGRDRSRDSVTRSNREVARSSGPCLWHGREGQHDAQDGARSSGVRPAGSPASTATSRSWTTRCTATGSTCGRHIESAATSAAIVDAYEDADPGVDGQRRGRRLLLRPRWAGEEPEAHRATIRRSSSGSCPNDIDDRSDGFKGILAEELSALQWRLTEKTPNVTTIVDCCHSARMFRDPDIVPRAETLGFPWTRSPPGGSVYVPPASSAAATSTRTPCRSSPASRTRAPTS